MPKRRKNRKRVPRKQQGGLLRGPSHANGGMPAIISGTEPVELEGGEYIIRKSSVAKYGERTIARINQGLVDANKLQKLKKGGKIEAKLPPKKPKFKKGGKLNPKGRKRFFTGGKTGRKRYYNGGRTTTSSRQCPPGQYLRNGRCVPGSTGQDFKSGGRVRNRRYQQGGSTSRTLASGETTQNANHVHNFVINSDGVVTIYETKHPNEPRIAHNHQYVGVWPNGYITQNASECYPNCNQMYGYSGAPPHSHNIQLTEQINTSNVRQTTISQPGRFRYDNSKRPYYGLVVYKDNIPYSTKSGTFEGNSKILERY